jgi:uncharacterized protein (TIGR02270 family)
MLDVIEEHFEELDFLWELREGVIFAPDWNLDDLAELEERAEAHLDGLRLAELHAVDIARPHLTGKFSGGATAAAFVLMETGDRELAAEVTRALAEAKEPARDGVRIGLKHSRVETVEPALFELARAGDAFVRAAAAEVLAFHRRQVPEIRDLVEADDDSVRILAYAALGRSAPHFGVKLLREGLAAKAPGVRRAALQAAARAALPELSEICREAAMRRPEPDAEAIAFLGVLGEPGDLAILSRALDDGTLATAALRGLGALGIPSSVPLIIEAMRASERAEFALAAFHRVTGRDDVRSKSTTPHLAAEDSIAAEFEDDLPPPDAERAAALWDALRAHLPRDRRVQSGRPLVAGAESELPLAVRRDLYFQECARDTGRRDRSEPEARARVQQASATRPGGASTSPARTGR